MKPSLFFVFLVLLLVTTVSADDEILPNIMGSDMVGRGYDAVSMEPRSLPIIKLTWNDDYTDPDNYWINPLDQNLAYRVPEEMVVQDEPESFIFNGSIISQTAEDYLSVVTQHFEKHGFLGFGSKSKTIVDVVHNYYLKDDSLIEFYQYITYYKLTIPPLPVPTLHPRVAAMIASLPPKYNSDNTSQEWKAYRNFFNIFGTHYMSQAKMGGAIKMTTYFHRCLLSQFSSHWVTEQSGWSFLGIINYKKGNSQYEGKVDVKWEDYSQSDTILQGGYSQLFDVTDWEEWLPTVKLNPFPVTFTLSPIYDLISDPDRKSAMEAAVADYAKEGLNQLNQEMLRLRPLDPHIVPSWCTKF